MYKFNKRLLDIFISLFALFILLPVFVPIILILRLSEKMLKKSMNMGTGSITLKDDPRVTKFGSILRKTKINELPQIINILKGDLSIVGPRPLVSRTFNAYSKDVQNKIYNVKPGLTGIGSIIFRDEESIISAVSDNDPHEFYKKVIAPYKGELELWYQNNNSFSLDLQLIFMTAWVILFPSSKLYEKWFKDLPQRKF